MLANNAVFIDELFALVAWKLEAADACWKMERTQRGDFLLLATLLCFGTLENFWLLKFFYLKYILKIQVKTKF